MLIPLMGAFLLEGCGTSKEAQLQQVAKDWCLTIRASQVIPVYPLTQDIQPGDIFLVDVPIDQQQQDYEANGFLALDNHISRITPSGYKNFYLDSFLTGTNQITLPVDWIRPASTNLHSWEPAPSAAFPSYSFSVSRGGGMNLAVPIDGVPVGMSLLDSDAAYGSVTIKSARTMGVDILSLYGDLTAWAKTNTAFLSPFGTDPGDPETNYLRVITRVYATGQMDVSLSDASSQSAGLDVGAAKPVNLLSPQLPKGQTNVAEVTAQNYTNGMSVLNDMLQKASSATSNFLPGGSLRIAAASSRTVALQEQFDPPVILGYLGFDCLINGDGTLGPPIPTHAHLKQKSKLNHAKVKKFNSDLKRQIDLCHAILSFYNSSTPQVQQGLRETAKTIGLLPDTSANGWPKRLQAQVNGNSPQTTSEFEDLSNHAR